MNGPLKIYTTKAIIRHDEPVELPGCMYKMKNILSGQKRQSSGGHVSSSPNKNLDLSEQKFQTTHPEMATLLARQEQILKQLEDLKEQMISLKGSLNLTQTTNMNELSCKNTIQSAGIISDEVKKASDIVINVSTSNPPYSLLILQKLWAQSVQLIIRTYFHSTVVNIPNKVNDFVAQIDNCEENTTIVPKLLIRLIWKEVDGNMELITSSSMNMPIHGETNIIRYFSRIGPSNWNYELQSNVADIDSVLDISYVLSRARTKTEKLQLIQSLNGSLAKNQWLCNSREISIADVVASSVIQQVTNPSDINVNVTKWIQRCQKTYSKAR